MIFWSHHTARAPQWNLNPFDSCHFLCVNLEIVWQRLKWSHQFLWNNIHYWVWIFRENDSIFKLIKWRVKLVAWRCNDMYAYRNVPWNACLAHQRSDAEMHFQWLYLNTIQWRWLFKCNTLTWQHKLTAFNSTRPKYIINFKCFRRRWKLLLIEKPFHFVFWYMRGYSNLCKSFLSASTKKIAHKYLNHYS